MAIAHAQLIAIYWALRNGAPYPEQIARIDQDRREAQIRYHLKRLTKLGYESETAWILNRKFDMSSSGRPMRRLKVSIVTGRFQAGSAELMLFMEAKMSVVANKMAAGTDHILSGLTKQLGVISKKGKPTERMLEETERLFDTASKMAKNA